MKVSDRAEHLGSGLLQKGLKPNPDTFIGIFAQNRPEVSADVTFLDVFKFCGVFLNIVLKCGLFHGQWIISELACYTYSMVAVPLYDTLGPEALVFIIDQGNWSFCCTIMLLITEPSPEPQQLPTEMIRVFVRSSLFTYLSQPRLQPVLHFPFSSSALFFYKPCFLFIIFHFANEPRRTALASTIAT